MYEPKTKKKKNNGNSKGKKKVINLQHNYINSDQIYGNNKFLKNYYYYFFELGNLAVPIPMNPKLGERPLYCPALTSGCNM